MMRKLLINVLFGIVLCGNSAGFGQDQMEFPVECRQWFRNPDGSCVQCSIGMVGVWENCPVATSLLFDTQYGPAIRGGSGPSRVDAYCEARQIPAYNVTGSNTWEWMRNACESGKMAAIGAGRVHFQTLVWFDPTPGESKPWRVCNNNSPSRIDSYSEAGFRQLHLSSGQWVVILKTPPPPMKPRFVKWW